VRPAAAANDESVLPLLAGTAVGLLGGAAWAAIVGLTNYEVGWVAWGIGGLIGFAMTRTTSRRSTRLAATAAVIAVVSLLVGKVLTQYFVTRPALEQALRESPDAIGAAAAWELRDTQAFPPELQVRLDALSETDTLPDALWEEMMAAGDAHAATLTPEERARLAAHYATTMQAGVSPWTQLRWGFSLWDLLWFGLAVSTAWRMLKAPAGAAA
jgi:hypothetical protein